MDKSIIPIKTGIQITFHPGDLVIANEILCRRAFITRSKAPYGLEMFAESVTEKIEVYVAVETVEVPLGLVGTLRELQVRFSKMPDENINALAKQQKKGE